MRPWLVSFTCCLHLFTQKRTYPVESSVSPLQLLTLDSRCCIPLHNCLYHQLLTLDSSLDLIWAAQQHFVRFQQVLAWTQQAADLLTKPLTTPKVREFCQMLGLGGSGGSWWFAEMHNQGGVLVLSVCALLLCLWTPYLVITSSPSFHGSSHDLWLVFSFVSLCLLCLYSWNFRAQSLFSSVSDTGH